MTPDGTYKVYFPMKLHFTTGYDIFKYNGSTKRPEMPDGLRGYLGILGKGLRGVPDAISYFTACFSRQIDPFDVDRGRTAQTDYERIGQSMTYFFEEDMYNLDSLEMDDVCMAAISGKIKLETLSILCTHCPLTFEWTHPLYDSIVFTAKKLEGFLRYDKSKVSNLISLKNVS